MTNTMLDFISHYVLVLVMFGRSLNHTLTSCFLEHYKCNSGSGNGYINIQLGDSVIQKQKQKSKTVLKLPAYSTSKTRSGLIFADTCDLIDARWRRSVATLCVLSQKRICSYSLEIVQVLCLFMIVLIYGTI